MTKEITRRDFLKLALLGAEVLALYTLIKEFNLSGETDLATVAQYYLEQPLRYQEALKQPNALPSLNQLSTYDWQAQTTVPLEVADPVSAFKRSLSSKQAISLSQEHFNPLKANKRIQTEFLAMQDYSKQGIVFFYRGADQLHDLEKAWIELLMMRGYGVLAVGYGEHEALPQTDYISNVTSPWALGKDIKEMRKLDYRESEDGLLALLNLQRQGLYHKKMPLHLIGLSYGGNQVIVLANLLRTLGMPVDRIFSYGGLHNFKHLNTDIFTPSDVLRDEFLHLRGQNLGFGQCRQIMEVLSPASYQNRLPTPWKNLILTNAADDTIVDPRQTQALAYSLSPAKRDYLVVPGGHFLDYQAAVDFYNQVQAGHYGYDGQTANDIAKAQQLAAGLPAIDQLPYKPEQKLAIFASTAAGL